MPTSPMTGEELHVEDLVPVHGGYDTRIITKLTKNYRSHPLILALPNRAFYDGDLEAVRGRLRASEASPPPQSTHPSIRPPSR